MKRVLAVIAVVVLGGIIWRATRSTSTQPAIAGPSSDRETVAQSSDGQSRMDQAAERSLTMADVLAMAEAALENMRSDLPDYSARFVKQEQDANGVLGEPTEIQLKVQTRFRDGADDAPRRAYLRFTKPSSLNGREVLWGEDLYDGKMAVHEVGMILGLKTIWLDPNGLIAMQGQRYPVSEVGLVKLVEKLIERGLVDRDNPEIKVNQRTDQVLDEKPVDLIEVTRAKPSGEPDDFSRAEIIVDPERQLILSYRAFGWPESIGKEAPLLESYTYHDLQTNIGLTDADFDTKNPNYDFPAF